VSTVSTNPGQEQAGPGRSAPANRATPRRQTPAEQRREHAILLGRVGRLWLAYMRGQLVLMFVIFAITWLGLTALGVPYALYLGVTAGLLEIVPNLGPALAGIVAALVALWKGSTYLEIDAPILAGLVVLFYVGLQLAENYVIVPRVMGDALKLPALVVLAGVIVGGVVGGVPGAVVAAPVMATGREVWRFYRHKKRGEDPFPPEKATP